MFVLSLLLMLKESLAKSLLVIDVFLFILWELKKEMAS
jgi:hypothetical protein